jgi:DNA-binding transcriptional ArsR family regulator
VAEVAGRSQAYAVSRAFHALSDATRREIIERLSDGPISVSQLAKPLGVSLAAVVQHLQVLEDCSLVRSEKVGRTRICQMQPAGLSVVESWIRERRSRWEKRFDRLGELLDEDEQGPGGG